MSAEPNFEGYPNRECGDHRTVGPHRAWCFPCHEWCYPDVPCEGCEPEGFVPTHGVYLG